MRVLFAAAEAVPFAKTGGLADVVGSLPKALRKQGVDARVIVPLYGDIPEKYRRAMKQVAAETVQLGWRRQYCGLYAMEHDGVPFYFVDNEYYFQRKGIYDFYDEAERFGFFSQAVLDIIPRLDAAPDILHCHDWHAGMVSVLLKARYGQTPWCKKIRTVFTIHNLGYQGVFPESVRGDIFNLDFDSEAVAALEFFGMINFMKGALEYSDLITTVSPSYAGEIKTWYWGEKLDGVLRKRGDDLIGIVNGIDTETYNPSADERLPAQFSAGRLKGKAINKQALQKEMGLDSSSDKPLVAIISRLVKAKGFDLVKRVLDDMIADDMQLIVLGTGEEYYQEAFRDAAARYPGKVAVRIGYDDGLAHRIYAGSDILLMPSQTEPCGVSQLIAMRYGCLPLVRETGGLKDTVDPYNPVTGAGDGFSFANFNAHDMLHVLQLACSIYRNDKRQWDSLVKGAMKADHSWKRSAGEYKSLYQRLMSRGDSR